MRLNVIWSALVASFLTSPVTLAQGRYLNYRLETLESVREINVPTESEVEFQLPGDWLGSYPDSKWKVKLHDVSSGKRATFTNGDAKVEVYFNDDDDEVARLAIRKNSLVMKTTYVGGVLFGLQVIATSKQHQFRTAAYEINIRPENTMPDGSALVLKSMSDAKDESPVQVSLRMSLADALSVELFQTDYYVNDGAKNSEVIYKHKFPRELRDDGWKITKTNSSNGLIYRITQDDVSIDIYADDYHNEFEIVGLNSETLAIKGVKAGRISSIEAIVQEEGGQAHNAQLGAFDLVVR